MKQIITLLICLLASLALQAQDEFPLQFVDENGEIIADGTMLDLTDIEEDDLFGDIMMPTNISVKNISDEMVQGGGSYTIHTISNGKFQTCFPINCMVQFTAGTYSTGNDAFMPGQLRNMQTEWLPDAEGMCFVSYQLQTYRKLGKNYIPDEDGPTITLCFYYGTTGIKGTKGEKVRSVTYYDLSGKPVERPKRGVYMKKTTYADGSFIVRKSILR